jgi:hypothetical protein
MASDGTNFYPSYDGYNLTSAEDDVPAFQYTIDADESTQNWPFLQPSQPASPFLPVDNDALNVEAAGLLMATPGSSSARPVQQQLPTRQYSNEEWETMQTIIVDLYIRQQRPLEKVMQIMEQDHAFKAR